jgi:hypothetical protein
MRRTMQKPIKIAFDASPLLVNKTGVAYYTERLVAELARKYPKQLELVGFYYNFLGKGQNQEKRSTKLRLTIYPRLIYD